MRGIEGVARAFAVIILALINAFALADSLIFLNAGFELISNLLGTGLLFGFSLMGNKAFLLTAPVPLPVPETIKKPF